MLINIYHSLPAKVQVLASNLGDISGAGMAS